MRKETGGNTPSGESRLVEATTQNGTSSLAAFAFALLAARAFANAFSSAPLAFFFLGVPLLAAPG